MPPAAGPVDRQRRHGHSPIVVRAERTAATVAVGWAHRPRPSTSARTCGVDPPRQGIRQGRESGHTRTALAGAHRPVSGPAPRVRRKDRQSTAATPWHRPPAAADASQSVPRQRSDPGAGPPHPRAVPPTGDQRAGPSDRLPPTRPRRRGLPWSPTRRHRFARPRRRRSPGPSWDQPHGWPVPAGRTSRRCSPGPGPGPDADRAVVG